MDTKEIWTMAVEVISTLGLNCRIKASFDNEVSGWAFPLFKPEEFYIELSGFGPVAEREIEWIDIDPVVMTKKGRLLPELKEDKKSLLHSALEQRKIRFDDMGEFVRVRNPVKPSRDC